MGSFPSWPNPVNDCSPLRSSFEYPAGSTDLDKKPLLPVGFSRLTVKFNEHENVFCIILTVVYLPPSLLLFENSQEGIGDNGKNA